MDKVKISNISKTFKLGKKTRQSFFGSLLNFFKRRNENQRLIALDDVNLSLSSGEILGIIGENGSGKSTLLKVIAGIYRPDSGKVFTDSEPVLVINLYSGLQDRLTVKENIYLLNSFLGYSKKEIKAKIPLILEFAGIQDYANISLYKLSDGMKIRLVFSICIINEPKILLMDELFEFGDINFKEKQIKKINELLKKGSSIILVSHMMDIIKKYCDRVIWIKSGKVFLEGNAKEVVDKYIKDSKSKIK